MNPIVTIEMAEAEVSDRRRRAAAWRTSTKHQPARSRVALGRALQRFGTRLAGESPSATGSRPAPASATRWT